MTPAAEFHNQRVVAVVVDWPKKGVRSLRKSLVAALAVVVLLGGCTDAGDTERSRVEQPGTTGIENAVVSGAPRNLPVAFLGINGSGLIGEPYSDPRLREVMTTLRPQLLRIFGGTTANFWDWRAGWFVQNVPLPKRIAGATRHEMKLEDFKALVDSAGAIPIFTLNVLTSTLEEQLAMLSHARNIGMPIKYVELGNELYGDRPSVLERYPTPQAYGAEASRWISSIKKGFPGVEVSIVGALAKQGKEPDARKTNWNPGVQSTVQGEDATSLHLYFGTGIKGRKALKTRGSVQSALDFAEKRLQTFREEDLRGVPLGTSAWVTEFNLFARKTPVPGTWLHGLVLSRVTLGLATEPRVSAAIMHSLVGNPVFAAVFGSRGSINPGKGFAKPLSPATSATPFSLTGAGSAMALLFKASEGATSAQQVDFGTGETGTGAPPLVGVLFTTKTGHRRLVIANLTDQRRTVSFHTLIKGPSQYVQVSGDPLTFVSGPDSLQRSEGSTSDRLSLPPYSITQID